MSIRNVWAVTRKELHHIHRDRMTLFLVGFMPTFLLFLLAYAFSTNVKHIRIAFVDLDRTPTSRSLIQQVTIGDLLDLYKVMSSPEEADDALQFNRIKAYLLIPSGFEKQLLTAQSIPLQVILDGTEPYSGGVVLNQILERTNGFTRKYLSDRLSANQAPDQDTEPFDIQFRVWYNPQLKFNIGLIPGLISIVLGLPGMSIAMTLAREREHGTFEQLLATPISKVDLLLGKMLPYIVSGLWNILLTTAVAKWWFQVPFRGNFALYLLLSTAFFFAILGIGMIIGVLIRSQATSLTVAFLAILFPGFFLTGVFFPLEAMPTFVQLESNFLPGTHFAIITRGIFVTGVGFQALWRNGAALAGLGVLYILIAAFFFRKKIA